MDTFKQLIKEALTPEFLKEGIDAEGALDNLDKWLPNLSPGPFHFYDIIDDGDVDEMVDLIHTYGDEDVLKDYGLDPWDRGDVTQLADYIISRGNKETDLIPQGKMPLHLKQELDQEYFDDFELKDHPDKKDEFYALLLKHVPKGDFGHLRKEVGELFGFTNVAPGSNAGEMIEYFRNLVLRGLDIQFKSNQVNEDEGYHPQKKYSMDEVKREIDLAVQQGEALLKYQDGDYGLEGTYEAWESLKEDLIEIHQQSVIENIEGFTNFVDNNDGNDLPNRSSGSFMTALLDIDGLLSALNFEEYDHKGYDLYSQEEWDEASNYWTLKTANLRNTKYD